MEEITVGEIQELLQHFSRNTFKARDCDAVVSWCIFNWQTLVVEKSLAYLKISYSAS